MEEKEWGEGWRREADKGVKKEVGEEGYRTEGKEKWEEAPGIKGWRKRIDEMEKGSEEEEEGEAREGGEEKQEGRGERP